MIRASSGRTLLWRIFIRNAAVLVAATVALVATPFQVRFPIPLRELVVVACGLVLVLVVNLAVLRTTLAPLARLTSLMERFDPLTPGERLPSDASGTEIRALTRSFNRMLDRLETERREASRRVLGAQEEERRRLARDLHDALGQSLTAVMLQAERIGRGVPSEQRPQLDSLRETARAGLEQLRRISHDIRPEALSDLGLTSALTALSTEVSFRTGLRIERHLQQGLPALDEQAELALYRVAQEALTNVVRHAGAAEAELALTAEDGRVALRVADDGVGISEANRDEGGGLRGMRERALLVGGELRVRSAPGGGTTITLLVPFARERT